MRKGSCGLSIVVTAEFDAIGRFRVPLSLSFKARLSMKFFSW